MRALGRYGADANLTTIYRLFFKVGTVHWILGRAVRLWSAHYDSGYLEVVTRGPEGAVAAHPRLRDAAPGALPRGRRLVRALDRAVGRQAREGRRDEVPDARRRLLSARCRVGLTIAPLAFRPARGMLVPMIATDTGSVRARGALVAVVSACVGAGRTPPPSQPDICEPFVEVPAIEACADQTTELAALPSGATFERRQLRALCVASFAACAPSREACAGRYCGPIP